MTPIATLAPMRYNRQPLARGLRHVAIKSKTAYSGGSQVVKQAHRVASVGKLATGFGFHRSVAFNLPSASMVSNPLALGKVFVSFVASLRNLTACTQSNICAKITFTNRLGFDKMSGVNNPYKRETACVVSTRPLLGHSHNGGATCP